MKLSAKRYTDYDRFAWFYNKYWSAEIPYQILTVLESLLLTKLPEGCRILDICCGTGQIAAALSERGFQVTGIDGSGAMLRYARRNAPKAQFILADARNFKLPAVYQGVISTFDSLNHIMSLEELTSVFRNVHAALLTGGLFLFDMNMEKGFRRHWRDHFSIVEKDSVCLLRGEYDPQERIGRYEFTLFRPVQKHWQRSDFALVERCYSETEVWSGLEEAGFKEVYAYDAAEDLGLEDHVGRTFFLVRKEA